MCGRYTLKTPRRTLAEHLGLDEGDMPLLGERYNIAPSQQVPALRADHTLAMMKWGLIPAWSREPKASFSNINARRETVATSRVFVPAFKARRCLMPADGFYEWTATAPKTPHHFRLADGAPFAFAGIWERWEKGAEPVESCALITTEANGVVGKVHHRMPAVLMREDYGFWLDPKASPAELLALLAPLPDERMVGFAVGGYVNNPRNEGPRCVEPAVGGGPAPDP